MHANFFDSYPIGAVIPEIRSALAASRCVVLNAPTGSGKSTVLPLALLPEPWLAGKKIVMLEPRRIAAYAVAAQLADNLGGALGSQVGYRMRLERKVSAETRLEVVTEGVLVRMLQNDPELTGVGLLVFDEFHERTLQSDLGMALALESRHVLRPDLRIMAMSATLEYNRVAELLDSAAVVRSEGRSFPVDVRYFPRHPERLLTAEISALILDACRTETGSMLVFLPGEAEIRMVAAALEQSTLDANVFDVVPLFGRMENAEQRKAIRPAAPGRRKIVLATSIAESSLTIDGIRIVIDGGLTKISSCSPVTGLSHLETVTISQASAAQRAGRAGRTEPGVAWRLWSAQEEQRREAMRPGEITYTDLSDLVLELAAWGCTDPAELCWMDVPPAAAWSVARTQLQNLELLDHANRITAFGKKVHACGLSTRIGCLAVRAMELGEGHLGCLLAGVLDGFDFRKSSWIDLLDILPKVGNDARFQTARKLAQELERRLKLASEKPDRQQISVGGLLALAFPERVARRRGAMGDTHYLLAGGRGAEWRETNKLCMHDFLVVLELDDRERNARIQMAVPVEAWELEELLPERFTTSVELDIDAGTLALSAVERRMLGGIVWSEKRSENPDRTALLQAVTTLLRKRGIDDLLPEAAKILQQKVALARRIEPEGSWPELSGNGIFRQLENALDAFLPERFGKQMLQQIDWFSLLASLLDGDQVRRLKALLPERIKLANGREMKIDYSGEQPVVAGKLQHFFGVYTHPALANGRLPLLIHLLSPAGRPVQITKDLPGFWHGSYAWVRKELRGRYPKHDWPENP